MTAIIQEPQTETSHLEELLGSIDEQIEIMAQPFDGIDTTGGFVMTTMPCATTATRISIATKC